MNRGKLTMLCLTGVRVKRVMQRISSPIVYMCAVALFVASALFLWQGWVDVSLWDEGFLWYGAQRLSAGDVPILDFYAYDIGRYAVLAAAMWLWGNTGVVALRFGLMLIQAAVLAGIAIYLFRRLTRAWPIVGGMMLVIIWWLWPLYRMPDFAVLSMALLVLARVQRSHLSNRDAFIAGMTYGLVLAAGGDVRKHGVFFVTSLVIVLALRMLKQRHRRSWLRQGLRVLYGFAIGLSPMAMYVFLTPGLLAAYTEHMVLGFLARDTANIPLPIPWPWLVTFETPIDGIRSLLIGLWFVVLLVLPVVMLVLLGWRAYLRHTIHPFAQACFVYAVPSIAYAYSRADLVHLAQGGFPLILGIMVWVFTERPTWFWPTIGILVVSSALIFVQVQPRLQCRQITDCRATQVGPDILSVPNQTADEISLLIQMRNDFVANDETLLIAPFWPGAYAMLGLKAPVWDIYAIWPRNDALQQREIQRIAAATPRAVIIMNKGMDDQSALRYSLSHRLVYTYLLETYDQIREYTTLPGYTILRIRDYD